MYPVSGNIPAEQGMVKREFFCSGEKGNGHVDTDPDAEKPASEAGGDLKCVRS